jgi:hypothetical protein
MPAISMQPMSMFISIKLEFWASACTPSRTIPKVKAAANRPIPIIGLIPPQSFVRRMEPHIHGRNYKGQMPAIAPYDDA